MIWAALKAAKDTNAPTNFMWTQQIRHSLRWLRCFLIGVKGVVVRDFTLAAYSRMGKKVTIQTDASPYGIGAVIYVDGHASEYLYDKMQSQGEV